MAVRPKSMDCVLSAKFDGTRSLSDTIGTGVQSATGPIWGFSPWSALSTAQSCGLTLCPEMTARNRAYKAPSEASEPDRTSRSFLIKRSRNRSTTFEAAALGESGSRLAEVEPKLFAQSTSSSVSRQMRLLWASWPRCLSSSRIACGRFPPDSPTGRLGCVSEATPRKTGVVGENMT